MTQYPKNTKVRKKCQLPQTNFLFSEVKIAIEIKKKKRKEPTSREGKGNREQGHKEFKYDRKLKGRVHLILCQGRVGTKL